MKTNNENFDYYRLKFGIRTLQWTSKNLLLNGEPLYLRGLGKHEDSIVSNLTINYMLISIKEIKGIQVLNRNFHF